MRYKIELRYDGKDFCGYQIQDNAPSVQAELEKALTQLNSNQEVSVVGCGRTDAGVHAYYYAAHVDVEQEGVLQNAVWKLNKMLPKSIAILSVERIHDTFHARFDAVKRTYRYFTHQQKNPFFENSSYFFPFDLDIEQMNEAAKLLLGEKDFGAFSKSNTQVNNNRCTVLEAFWYKDGEQLVFQISANRFLRNMVRAIVGTLMEVGERKLNRTDFETIIAKKDRQLAGYSVPAQGLFLWDVEYATRQKTE